MENKQLATISILVKDRQQHSPDVNNILTKNGHLILARLGVNVQRHCIEHCTAIITVVVEGSMEEIDNIMKQLSALENIVAKNNTLTN